MTDTTVPGIRRPARRGLARHREKTGDAGMEPGFLGLLMFVASEIMFFAGLFGAYWTFRADAPVWPPLGPHGPYEELSVSYAAGLTVLLVTSSLTMQAAIVAIRRDRQRAATAMTGLTLLLGIVFVAGQAKEWMDLDFALRDGVYPSLFFTITGFHGLHVIGGLVGMMFVMWKSVQGAFSAKNHVMMESVSFYWHFVDVVWLVVFSTLYIFQSSGSHGA